MGSQKTKVGKRILRVAGLVILFLGIIAVTIFATTNEKDEAYGQVNMSYAMMEIGRMLMVVLGVIISISVVTKAVLSNKIKTSCQEKFTLALSLKPECLNSFSEMKENLSEYRTRTQQYLTDVHNLQTDMTELKAHFANMKETMIELKNKINKHYK